MCINARYGLWAWDVNNNLAYITQNYSLIRTYELVASFTLISDLISLRQHSVLLPSYSSATLYLHGVPRGSFVRHSHMQTFILLHLNLSLTQLSLNTLFHFRTKPIQACTVIRTFDFYTKTFIQGITQHMPSFGSLPSPL